MRELFGKVGDDDGGGLYAEGLKYDPNIGGGDLCGVDRDPVVADHWRRENVDMTGRSSTPCLWSRVSRYSVMISERARVPAQIGANCGCLGQHSGGNHETNIYWEGIPNVLGLVYPYNPSGADRRLASPMTQPKKWVLTGSDGNGKYGFTKDTLWCTK